MVVVCQLKPGESYPGYLVRLMSLDTPADVLNFEMNGFVEALGNKEIYFRVVRTKHMQEGLVGIAEIGFEDGGLHGNGYMAAVSGLLSSGRWLQSKLPLEF